MVSVSASTDSPWAIHCETLVVTKSPGGSWIIAKETMEMNSKVGKASSTRRKMRTIT